MSTYLDGKIIVAPPKMSDWRFARSVVYVWKHDVSGAGGIIINKRVHAPTFEDICKETGIKRLDSVNPPVFYGGPVMTNLVGCLHSLDYKINATNVVSNHTGFTLDATVIDQIARGQGPKKYLLTMGISSWNPGQLESEIEALPPRSKSGSWLYMDYDEAIVFGPKTETLWTDCVSQCIRNTTSEITRKIFPN